jgi:malate/lactate dehydrogenase
MEFAWRVRDVCEMERAKGGRVIERLDGASLAAVAGATGRTVRELLEDNGYQRPVNVASDDAHGG